MPAAPTDITRVPPKQDQEKAKLVLTELLVAMSAAASLAQHFKPAPIHPSNVAMSFSLDQPVSYDHTCFTVQMVMLSPLAGMDQNKIATIQKGLIDWLQPAWPASGGGLRNATDAQLQKAAKYFNTAPKSVYKPFETSLEYLQSLGDVKRRACLFDFAKDSNKLIKLESFLKERGKKVLYVHMMIDLYNNLKDDVLPNLNKSNINLCLSFLSAYDNYAAAMSRHRNSLAAYPADVHLGIRHVLRGLGQMPSQWLASWPRVGVLDNIAEAMLRVPLTVRTASNAKHFYIDLLQILHNAKKVPRYTNSRFE
jgi:hypothetical protein